MVKSHLVFVLIGLALITGCSNKKKDVDKTVNINSNVIKPEDVDQEKIKAREVCETWVKIIDSRNFIYAYQQTSIYFKATVPESDWQKFTDSIGVFGTNVSRQFMSAEYFQGNAENKIFEYIVCKFKSSFSGKKSATETISVIREANQWKLMGYFID